MEQLQNTENMRKTNNNKHDVLGNRWKNQPQETNQTSQKQIEPEKKTPQNMRASCTHREVLSVHTDAARHKNEQYLGKTKFSLARHVQRKELMELDPSSKVREWVEINTFPNPLILRC